MAKKTTIQTVVAILFFTIACAGAILFSEKQSEKQNRLSQTIMPRITTIVQKKMISGNLYPVKEIEVKSAVSGTLETYYVQTGDKIKIGDKVAKIKMLPEPAQVENARKNLNTARIGFENDKSNYERDATLFEKGVISKAEFEASSRTYLVGKEQYESAKNQLSLLEEGYIPASNISNVITATANGTIIDLPLEEGTPVAERNTFRDGSTIALIAQLDSFLFKGRVVENDVLVLKKGMKIKVTPTSQSNYEAEATIRKISPKGNWDQGVMKYDIEAILSLPDSISVYSGFNAIAEFVLKEKKEVLTIPEACLVFRNDSAFVEVLEHEEFVKKGVDIGISDGVNIEIVNGIGEDDKIKKLIF
ncbi:membrane protein [Synergistales bacterium]|nr:membrane protein [Synergistales bacterium]